MDVHGVTCGLQDACSNLQPAVLAGLECKKGSFQAWDMRRCLFGKQAGDPPCHVCALSACYSMRTRQSARNFATKVNDLPMPSQSHTYGLRSTAAWRKWAGHNSESPPQTKCSLLERWSHTTIGSMLAHSLCITLASGHLPDAALTAANVIYDEAERMPPVPCDVGNRSFAPARPPSPRLGVVVSVPDTRHEWHVRSAQFRTGTPAPSGAPRAGGRAQADVEMRQPCKALAHC